MLSTEIAVAVAVAVSQTVTVNSVEVVAEVAGTVKAETIARLCCSFPKMVVAVAVVAVAVMMVVWITIAVAVVVAAKESKQRLSRSLDKA